MQRIFARVGIKGNVHRFRDTFSVELLRQGADLRIVSQLLGHASVKTTEKHYVPWVGAFQAQDDHAISTLYANRTRRKRTGKLFVING